MPNTWTAPEEQVDQAAQTAEALARAGSHGGGSTLPELANAKLDESAARRFLDWLNSLFKIDSKPTWDLAFLLQFAKWIGIALIVFGLLYLAYRLVTRPRGPAARRVAHAPLLSTETLSLELDEALAAGQFAKAARLRWRLFLHRNERTPDMTPYEHFRAQRATLEAWLAKQYSTMFAGRTLTRDDYDDLESRLSSLEPAGGGRDA